MLVWFALPVTIRADWATLSTAVRVAGEVRRDLTTVRGVTCDAARRPSDRSRSTAQLITARASNCLTAEHWAAAFVAGMFRGHRVVSRC